MHEVDTQQFWCDNDAARANPFDPEVPQPAMDIQMGYHTVFDELGIEEDLWRVETDYDYAREIAECYNNLAEQIVGRRLLNETQFDPSRRFPELRSVGEIFGCRKIWQSNSWWLLECAHTPQQLEKVLDRVEKLDLAAEIFPENWERRCGEIYDRHGIRPRPPRHLRGPVTLATSIYGVENLIYLILDEPALAERFRDVLCRTILEYFRICRRAVPQATPVRGFSFADDNCAMLTAEMYGFFAQPILKAVFAEFAPEPGDMRYQHSDSDMAHLLPLLAETGLTRVNFGPNVRFAQIRAAMPGAVVEGTLAPFTLMRNDIPRIFAEVRRDIAEAAPTHGLVVATAGSVNNGSRLSSMRAIMSLLQQEGWGVGVVSLSRS